jgi:hypothetical protein
MAKTFGPSLLVGVGWFVTAVTASAVGEWSVPEQPDRDCSAFGACLSMLDVLPVLVVVAGAPLLLVLLAVTAVVTRSKLPPALAGTLSAAVTAAVAAAAVYGATR